MQRLGLGLVLVFLAVSTLGACKRVKGSCDRRAGVSKTCVDAKKADLEVDCKASPDSSKRGVWSSSPCDLTGAIGACDRDDSREWYYSGGRASKIEHVAAICDPVPTLDTNGKEVKVTPEKLPAVALTDPAVLALGAPWKAQLDANTTAIMNIKAAGPVPGTVKLSGGKHVAKLDSTAAVWEREVTGFTDQTLASNALFPTRDGADFHRCGVGWKKQDRQGLTDDQLKTAFQRCAGLTTLIVLTPAKLEKPKKKGTEFYGGVAIGTAYVYELPSGRFAGGYPFTADSSNSTNNIEGDFAVNLQKALSAGIAKADPGATYTFSIITM